MISTRGRYALHLMLDLAVYGEGGRTISLKEIAARQKISLKYLEQIISILNKAGYVKSVRGPQGGYRLSRDPKDYTVGTLLRLTEGTLAPVECLSGYSEPCEKQKNCTTVLLWKQVQEAVDGVVDHVTLADLAELEKDKLRQAEPAAEEQA